ncbi:hypothetical protein IFM89_038987 [Coptis chinensis]|uniref:Uncharacterized protein n=1 Tax=Coptis chinensis TaxID=261450 RepID=A0A835IH24_9MAGN|nr:hypothetical protein IFM89_038987 [Coptis chinensis]
MHPLAYQVISFIRKICKTCPSAAIPNGDWSDLFHEQCTFDFGSKVLEEVPFAIKCIGESHENDPKASCSPLLISMLSSLSLNIYNVMQGFLLLRLPRLGFMDRLSCMRYGGGDILDPLVLDNHFSNCLGRVLHTLTCITLHETRCSKSYIEQRTEVGEY